MRVHHGTADLVTLPEWSEATVAAMQGSGVDAQLVAWPDEGHRLRTSWPGFRDQLLDFFSAELR